MAKKKAAKPVKGKLFFHWEGKDRLSSSEEASIRARTKRRARRHFRGETVKHRVIEHTPFTITFAFKRRTGKPVSIRWRKPEGEHLSSP